MYTIAVEPTGHRLRVEGCGIGRDPLDQWVRELLQNKALTFDPLHVKGLEQNRVETLTSLIRTGRITRHSRSQFENLGVKYAHRRTRSQVRALLSEGKTLLGWVGGLSDDPEAFEGPRARAALRSLLPALRSRLLLEQRFEGAPLLAAALDATFNASTEAMYLVDRTGRIVLCNRLGATSLPSRQECVDAFRGQSSEFRTFAVTGAGLAPHCLLVRHRAQPDLVARLALAQREWQLTPAEARVLRLLAQGLPNHSIARELGCALRTIELHTTHLLRKAGVDGRTELVASFWAGRSMKSLA
jgi:DNA-binding CsgD family transcriptional regulator/PAS domain-containing protein